MISLPFSKVSNWPLENKDQHRNTTTAISEFYKDCLRGQGTIRRPTPRCFQSRNLRNTCTIEEVKRLSVAEKNDQLSVLVTVYFKHFSISWWRNARKISLYLLAL